VGVALELIAELGPRRKAPIVRLRDDALELAGVDDRGDVDEGAGWACQGSPWRR
jgi:hypothetical protein